MSKIITQYTLRSGFSLGYLSWMYWNGAPTGTSLRGWGVSYWDGVSSREQGVFTGTGRLRDQDRSLGHQWRVGRLREQDGCYSGRLLYFNLKMNLDLGSRLQIEDELGSWIGFEVARFCFTVHKIISLMLKQSQRCFTQIISS